jgi:hypothetical protein
MHRTGSLVEGQPAIETSQLVSIAAPHSMPRIFQGFGASAGLMARSQSWCDANVRRLTGRDLTTFETVDVLQRTQTPTLVLHTPNDRQVSLDSAEAPVAAGDRVTLKVLPVLATGASSMRRQPCRLSSNSWPGDGPHPAALRTPRRT